MGDLNEIPFSNKKHWGHFRAERAMEDFRSMFEDAELTDLGYEGQWYTWVRVRLTHNNIQEKLDWEVARVDWIDMFTNYSYCVHSISNHFLLVLDTDFTAFQQERKRAKPQFEACWLLEETCEDEVGHLWEGSVAPVPIRIRHICEGLSSWVKMIRGLSRADIFFLQKYLGEFCDVPGDTVLKKWFLPRSENGGRRKTRGRTLLKDLYNLNSVEHVKVSRNSQGQPIGSEARVLAGYLGIIARNVNLLPINYESWHHMPDSNKNHALDNIKELLFGQKVGHLQLFDITHRKKDGFSMTTEAAKIMDKKVEYKVTVSSDSSINLDNIDNRVITEVLGPERYGRFNFKDLSLAQPNILDPAHSSTCLR
ncbi:hypothetical protein PVK06_024908 [Gossypium arboreum]|uniref:Uncharacterized protein n=1 Tax=Gossypium arboreum TaxID=29729 RepID=A0ABR0PEY3_GOSAR|nr:hypothetical protein PVK06_024908 [Gossypium arboreum]